MLRDIRSVPRVLAARICLRGAATVASAKTLTNEELAGMVLTSTHLQRHGWPRRPKCAARAMCRRRGEPTCRHDTANASRAGQPRCSSSLARDAHWRSSRRVGPGRPMAVDAATAAACAAAIAPGRAAPGTPSSASRPSRSCACEATARVFFKASGGEKRWSGRLSHWDQCVLGPSDDALQPQALVLSLGMRQRWRGLDCYSLADHDKPC